MEQKIDGLLALIAQSENGRGPKIHKDGNHTSPTTFNSTPSTANTQQAYSPPSQSSPYRSDPGLETLQSRHEPSSRQAHISSPVFHDNPVHNNLAPTDPLTNRSSPECDLVKDLVDVSYAKQLLGEFRTMSDYFPFVLISPNTTVQGLSLKKPMLFLAILMTASGSDRILQITLEERYRRELATKVIVKSHRSLDCLQSILIYLAW